jgi:hypothetical protein
VANSRMLRIPFCLIPALLIAGLVGCGDPSTPSPDGQRALEKAIWGPTRLPDGSSAFPTYKELGVDTYQIQLRWAEVAPSRPASPEDPADPAYRWPGDLDFAIEEATEREIETAVLVTTAPPWANGDREPIQSPQRAMDFGQFLSAASRRYPSVRRWMIWGEPNRSDRFLPNRPDDPVGARRYAVLLDRAYMALKEVSPDNIVIGGNTFTGGDVKPARFIRWLRLPSGEAPRLDWYGHNPYPFRFPDLRNPPFAGGWRDLSDLETLVDDVNDAYRSRGTRPRLWLSEFTVQSDHSSAVLRDSVSRAAQARWLRAGYEVAGSVEEVAGLGWFKLLDDPDRPGHAHWGLLTSDGGRKPAFRAYADAR